MSAFAVAMRGIAQKVREDKSVQSEFVRALLLFARCKKGRINNATKTL
jgi:hypothetical protein